MRRRRPAAHRVALLALAVLAAAVGPVAAQRLPLEMSLRFWRLHQPDSPFHDPDWMWEREDPETAGRYGARNAREAYAMVSSPNIEADSDLEPQGLERKLLLASPLMGRSNVLPLLLEPPANLVAVLAERFVLGKDIHGGRIEAPPGFIAIDTHVHTCYSHDSVADPARVLLTAARRGLAGIAITDHETVEGGLRAQAIAERLKAQRKLPANFGVIAGEEVRTREGHVIGLFLHQTIPPEMTAAATVAAIHAQGGLAIAVHPMLPGDLGRLCATLPFDAVESIDAGEDLHFSLESAENNRKRAAFYAALPPGPRLGASDAHDPSVVGLGYTLIPGPTVDEASLRRALTNRETQPCRMAGEQRLQRQARHLPRPALPALRALRQGLGWGSRMLKRLTGADLAQFRPSVSRGGFGASLLLTKRF